ncbi:RodZ domain-containing protein [Calothrix sp. 336/3]|uniref:RodZ domain-containing protein n=1 Tax=Calothrix sp. 336/3 TaxID=1337936 RepID=UPI00062496B4|nr:DNA-binding protein [Calothrix sp. 336/3]
MNSFNDAQQEQLKEIGEHLRKVREEKSIRLEQIAAQTLIRLIFLQALEEGRFEDLPEPIFVQGFIKRYGDALGLEGTTLAKNFAINFFLLDSDSQNISVSSKPSFHIPLIVPYSLLLAAASLGLFYLLNLQQRNEQVSQTKTVRTIAKSPQKPVTTPKAPVEPQTIVSPTAPIASPPVVSTASPTVPPLNTPTPESTSANTPVEVTLQLQEQSWLRIKIDGKIAFEGVMNKGDKKTWNAQKELTIRSGNAGAVLISTKTEEAKPLGDVGSVKQVTFTSQVNNQQSTINNQETTVNNQ